VAIAHANALDGLEGNAPVRATPQGVAHLGDARVKREFLEEQTSEILAKNCEEQGLQRQRVEAGR
jgi:hypothetical protein